MICLRGGAEVEVDGQRFAATPYDAVYAPRGSQVRVTPAAEGCDFAEIAAPVEGTYPVQFVSLCESACRIPRCIFRRAAPTTRAT